MLIELFNIGIPVVRTDGRAYGHVMTKFSRMGRLPHFLTHGVPLRARELRYKQQFFVGKGSKGLYGRRRLLPSVPIAPLHLTPPTSRFMHTKTPSVADIRFFSSVEIWRFFLFDSPFSHCPYAPIILFSSLKHTLPPPPCEIGNNGRGEQGVLRAM